MTPRSIRRAAERRANKLARKAFQAGQSPESVAQTNSSSLADSTEELAAQPSGQSVPSAAEANAHLTAAISPLTGHAMVLHVADAAQYTQVLHAYQAQYQPVGMLESNLVQSLADIAWRSRRLLALEDAIFAKGRIEFADQFTEHAPELRLPLLDVHTFLTYEKQLRTLQLQEARLTRRAEKETAELRRLQLERSRREEPVPQWKAQAAAPTGRTLSTLHENGFVFSNPAVAVTRVLNQTHFEAA